MSANTASSIAVTGLDAVYYLAKDFKRGVAFYRDSWVFNRLVRERRNFGVRSSAMEIRSAFRYMPASGIRAAARFSQLRIIDAAVAAPRRPASSSTPTAHSNRPFVTSRVLKTAKATIRHP